MAGTTIFRLMEGYGGGIEIPFLGASVGTIVSWKLRRRAEAGPEAELFDLTAVLSYLSTPLWDDPDYDKVVMIRWRNGKSIRIESTGGRVVATPTSLYMEAVRPCLEP